MAAPPASSDRLIHPDHLGEPQPGIRLYTVRVDIEQGAGRVFVVVNPEAILVRAAEGIEWDFRYLGGADAIVEEVIIEFPKPSVFSKTSFKSQKPGSARPHRQLSGPANNASAGKKIEYLIRCFNLVKSEVAVGRGNVSIQPG